MAKFRNVNKRRNYRTGKARVSAYHGGAIRKSQLVSLGQAKRKTWLASLWELWEWAMALMIPDDGDVRALGSAPLDGGVIVKYLSLRIFRLRRKLREFFAAARFQHSAAWLLASRQQSWP